VLGCLEKIGEGEMTDKKTNAEVLTHVKEKKSLLSEIRKIKGGGLVIF